MKRILLIPKDSQGVIYVPSLDYVILNNVNNTGVIRQQVWQKGKNIAAYKFCQFDNKAIIPYFMKVKDKLGTIDGMLEFECESVKFEELPLDDKMKKEMIEKRHIAPLQEQMKNIVYQTNFNMAMEKLGEKIDDDVFVQLGIKKDELKTKMNEFDYTKYLQEIV